MTAPFRRSCRITGRIPGLVPGLGRALTWAGELGVDSMTGGTGTEGQVGCHGDAGGGRCRDLRRDGERTGGAKISTGTPSTGARLRPTYGVYGNESSQRRRQ